MTKTKTGSGSKVPSRSRGTSMRYMACDDKGTFCMPVEQAYDLELVRRDTA